MANVKVITNAVVNGNPVGSTLSVTEKEAEWLMSLGYADKVVEKKSAKKRSTKSDAKDESKEDTTDKDTKDSESEE